MPPAPGAPVHDLGAQYMSWGPVQAVEGGHDPPAPPLDPPMNPSIEYLVKSCQQQGNGYDCGVFAIAFAVSLVFGENPSQLVYNPAKLRNHLKISFSSNIL